MFFHKHFLLFCIICPWYYLLILSSGVGSISGVATGASLNPMVAFGIIKLIYEVGEEVIEFLPDSENRVPLIVEDVKEKEVLKKINELHQEVNKIAVSVDDSQRILESNIRSHISHHIKAWTTLNELRRYITIVNVQHKAFSRYINTSQRFEKNTLADFAFHATSHDSNSLINILERIHEILIPHEGGLLHEGVLELVADTFQEANIELCNLKQSPQQIVYNLYNTIALTELKGYAMIQFSYMLLKLYNKGNYTEEANVMRLRYEERTTAMINKVKMVMGKLTKEELWVCDPKIHVQDETYVEITNLLQGYIENEVDLNGDGTCRENCPFYTYTKSHGCFKDMYCSQQKRCNGKIIGCQYVDSDMWICQAPESSSRRYEYIEYENGRILGQKTSCQKGATKVDSWWRWVFWHCSYCFCLCDDVGKNSDRYFNLRDVRSDIEHNRVVTGLRFTKQNKIIHLQVQEGELLPGANIDKNTVKWISPENYAITDRNVYNGQDYHTLTWEQRSLDLDDIKAPDGHVVTGVRFRKIGTHLNFEISVSPFNFSSGMLLNPKEKSVWMGNDNTDSSRNPRREIGLHAPDVPTRSRAPSTPGSYHNSYIKFTHSDINKDAAQTTVPFVDAQPVSSSIPLALGGAGIYHKGQLGYGGFVAPKIIMYDMSKHIKAEYPAAEIIN